MINNLLKIHSLIHKLRIIGRFCKYLPKYMYNDLEDLIDDYYYLCTLSYRLYKKGVNVDEIQ